MRKQLLILFFFFVCSNSYAKYGTGDLLLNDKVVNNFKNYLEGPKGKPVKFLVTEDGNDSYGWYCAHSQCVPTGSMNEEALCERRFGKKCFIFAIGRSVKWNNEKIKNASSKEKRFSSKDSIEEIKAKLIVLGLYGNEFKASPTSTSSQGVRVGKRSIAMSWANYNNLIVGEIEFVEKSNVGALNLKLPNNDGSCNGTYSLSTSQGTWSLLCTNNMNASGTLVWNNVDGSVTGEGKDPKGNKVLFTVSEEKAPTNNKASIVTSTPKSKWPAFMTAEIPSNLLDKLDINSNNEIKKLLEQMKPKNKEEEKAFMKVIIQTANAKIMLGQMNVSTNEKILLEQLLKKYIS
jgi:hypothetical protein